MVTPTVFEALWKSAGVAGRFTVRVRATPDPEVVVAHLAHRGYRPIAHGSRAGVHKVYFYASRPQGSEGQVTFLAEFVVVPQDHVLHAVFKCSHPPTVASFVRMLQLAQLFQPTEDDQ